MGYDMHSRPFITVVAVLLAACAEAVAVAQPLPQGQDLTFIYNPPALTPDGSAVALVSCPARLSFEESAAYDSGAACPLSVQDMSGRTLATLKGAIKPSTTASYNGFRWSPDGSKLAYIAKKDSQWLLHAWDRKRNVTTQFKTPVCDRLCDENPISYRPSWSPDGRTVYVHAFYFGAPSDAISVEVAESERRFSLLYNDPVNRGISVRSFPDPSGVAERGNPGVVFRTEILAADVTSGQIVPIFKAPDIRHMVLSPDGKSMLVAIFSERDRRVAQRYFDIYIVPLGRRGLSPQWNVEPGGKTATASERSLQPVHSRINAMGRPPSWSPDSRSFAYTDTGARSTGDIFIVDASSGRVRNLTATAILPDQALVAEGNANSDRAGIFYPGKFGANLYWSRNGRSLYATRVDRQGEGLSGMGLWSVPLATGVPRSLTAGAQFILTGIAHSNGTILSSGNSRSITAAVRLAPGQDGQANGAFVEISEAGGNPRVLVRLPGMIDGGVLAHGFEGPFTGFTIENSTTPPEAYRVDLRSGELLQLTNVNAELAKIDFGERRLFFWISKTGVRHKGLLYLPPTALRPAAGKKIPVVMEVYPGVNYVAGDLGLYIGRPSLPRPGTHHVLARGYAVIRPDLPVAGNGETCKTLGKDVESALDAAAGAGPIDTSRAAVYGYSFGGWSVNCIVTQTNRFKAAIAGAGKSNMVSTSFSLVGKASNDRYTGGQVQTNKFIHDAPARFMAESPVLYADKVQTPLLLLHGKKDAVVPFEDAVQMYVALSKLGKTVTLVGYDQGDHGRVSLFADYKRRVIEWLDKHIGKP